jgi:hypothetical protein
VSVYGTYIAESPLYAPVQITRRDGVKQTYWKRTRLTEPAAESGRYDFHGQGRQLYRAIMLAHKYVPRKRFVDVSAEEFIKNPLKYGMEGRWIDREVDSG